MGNQVSKATSDDRSSATLEYGPQRIEFCKSPTTELSNGKSSLAFWECTTCGQRYVDPAATSLLISPPPTTECILIKTDETWTHASGGVVSISIVGGATCDYVRVNRAVGEIDLNEKIAEPEESASAVEPLDVKDVSVRACDLPSIKLEGEHGRVSRQSAAANRYCDEDNDGDCEFWNAQCKDIDCIYEGDHCRYQCAMAELDEEPKTEVPGPERGFRVWRSAKQWCLRIKHMIAFCILGRGVMLGVSS